jgi:cystathionine gamma-synthase
VAEDRETPHRETLAAQGMGRVAVPYRDIVPPIHVATTYERGADNGYPGGRVYSRADNPTYDPAEALIASLEGASSALLFASGQAAAAAVFQSLAPGDRVLVPLRMYWALRKWLLEFAAPWGLDVELYDNASPEELAAKARARPPRLIWIETPANPTWDVTDITAASAIGRELGAVVAVDSTAATPMLTRPLELGAHIVMHSATKYLNGHSDVIGGALATARDDELWQRIRYARAGGGAVRDRSRRGSCCAACARCTCAWRPRPRTRSRSHSASAATEGFARAVSRPADASGTCRCAEADARRVRRHDVVASRGGESAAIAFAAKLRVFKRATSLGTVESLAEHRASVEGRARCVRRISCGCRSASSTSTT